MAWYELFLGRLHVTFDGASTIRRSIHHEGDGEAAGESLRWSYDRGYWDLGWRMRRVTVYQEWFRNELDVDIRCESLCYVKL